MKSFFFVVPRLFYKRGTVESSIFVVPRKNEDFDKDIKKRGTER